MGGAVRILLLCLTVCLATFAGPQTAHAQLTKADLEPFVMPPFSIGEPINEKGVWELLNSGGALAGYVFETEEMAPLPGFSGAPINIFVMLDLNGTFMDVRLISHNEPIFVSGLGEAPLRKFFEQYRGLSINQSLVVGNPYGGAGEGSALIYLDGVTKATASIRIAHESILAATRAVAREKMQGVASAPPAYPNPKYTEDLDWNALVADGLVTRKTVLNKEVNAAFAGTVFVNDDPVAQADPDGVYLDLYVVDIGAQSIAAAALSPQTLRELQTFQRISKTDEPILLIDAGRHGLVSPDFVRNTSPDWISAEQDKLPIALRDADLFVTLSPQAPQGTAIILRTDRRLGFDPTREWTLNVQAIREHGQFMPQIGQTTLTATHATPDRFYLRPVEEVAESPFAGAVRNRQSDLIVLGVFLMGLLVVLGPGQKRFAALTGFTPVRLAILAFVLGFVGWWGQGQLSIVTVLGVIRTTVFGGSFNFLLYDPFGTLIWVVAIAGFVLWGRGLFCGWLCPFGALQEFAHHLGRLLRLPQWEVNRTWDQRLKWIKYVLLAGLVATIFIAPDSTDKVAEIEPFKTAITVFFVRDWYYVIYAAFWLILGMVTFKGFCRYVCPLGAVMAIGGMIRTRSWIPRRADCGSPCQLCRVKCKYGAIKKTGEIQYDECFQCLDCVTIHDDPKQCVPLILAARDRRKAA
ncbi:MAG: 4Fe-4S binding protein [Alphaproteobacteria bacterium]|nr:4Fe-4S binding protein [Alphaproteobacteria bacterium]